MIRGQPGGAKDRRRPADGRGQPVRPPVTNAADRRRLWPHQAERSSRAAGASADGMSRMDDAALVALAAELATQAGAAILQVRRGGFDVSRKADRSPVTAADHAAEAIIVAGLRAATPDIPVIAEEEVAAGRITAPSAQFWLVDPLDGTREFAAGSDEFAVNIGLVRDGRVVLGVVGVPAADEMFGGIVGAGAWKRTAAGRDADRGAVASGRRGSPCWRAGIMAIPRSSMRSCAGRRVARMLNFGSSLKFCRLAEGIADLYPRFGRTMEWDTCAPQAVLEAAGGSVRTLDGAPLGYGKPGWEKPALLCAGSHAGQECRERRRSGEGVGRRAGRATRASLTPR